MLVPLADMPERFLIFMNTVIPLNTCVSMLSFFRPFAAAGLFTLAMWAVAFMPAHAAVPNAECHRLPQAALMYLKSLDPGVVVREDCLAVLSGKRSYIPVLPQSHEHETPPARVMQQFPTKTASPDWVQFDKGFYLLRLIETDTGKITLPRNENLPAEIKTGLLPQNFIVPKGFSIPGELRVIVGNLPYTTPTAQESTASTGTSHSPAKTGPNVPTAKPTTPSNTPVSSTASTSPVKGNATPSSSSVSGSTTPPGNSGLDAVTEQLTEANTITDPILITASLKNSTLTAWDAVGWKPKWRYTLPCLSTQAVATPTGEYLYAACLGSPKIEVLDIRGRQRRLELELKHAAQQLQLHSPTNTILALHRNVNQITFIDGQTHLIRGQLTLPIPVQRLTVHPAFSLAYGISADGHRVVELDLSTRKLTRQFNLGEEKPKVLPAPALRDVMWMDKTHGRIGILWLASTKNTELVGVDVYTGERAYMLNLPSPVQQNLDFPLVMNTEKSVDTQEPPLLLLKPKAGEFSQYTRVVWKENRPVLSEAKPFEPMATTSPGAPIENAPVETAAAPAAKQWLSFTAAAQPNSFIGVEGSSGAAHRVEWNPATETLAWEASPLLQDARSQMLVYIMEPTPERLQALEAQAAKARQRPTEEAETLTQIAPQPRRQSILKRLGEVLRFAPRDQ
jgi:hypothetical protein